jgi:HD-like signal output (HDOD) protein
MEVDPQTDSKKLVAETLASVGEIATLPEVALRIMEVAEESNANPADLADLIRHDPALASKLLAVANSAFYGQPGQVSTIDRAIILLGFSEIKNLAVAVSLAPVFEGPRYPGLFDLSSLWTHSISVAVAARKLARVSGGPLTPDEMFVAGLIHDIGLIIERKAFSRELAEVCVQYSAGEAAFTDLEREIIGATHQDFGLAIAMKWRLPRTCSLQRASTTTPRSCPGNVDRVWPSCAVQTSCAVPRGSAWIRRPATRNPDRACSRKRSWRRPI